MYLLDTNVVSELRKAKAGRADQNVASWTVGIDPKVQFISAVSVYELEVGTRRKEWRDAKQGALLRIWLETEVLPVFAGRILPIDAEIARCAARFQIPDPLSLQDGLIAATAIVHKMTVVTRNVADFARAGVRLLNPWEPQSS